MFGTLLKQLKSSVLGVVATHRAETVVPGQIEAVDSRAESRMESAPGRTLDDSFKFSALEDLNSGCTLAAFSNCLYTAPWPHGQSLTEQNE
jgi:hypothetical protein